MSEASGFGDFGKWVPGFEFLQSLTRPGAAPSAGPAAWVAPTLSEEEIDKRVQELKAVLFWLEQNTTALKATIQALEVQKMTLSALKGMNVSLQDMAQAFSTKSPAGAGTAAPAAPAKAEATAPNAKPKPAAARSSKSRGRTQATSSAAPGVVDPMQWWGALTQQFQQIASAAMADAQTQKPGTKAQKPAPAPAGAASDGQSKPRKPQASKGATARGTARKRAA